MGEQPAIVVEGVSKLYRRAAPGGQLRTLKSALLDRSLTAGLTPDESIAALCDVSFTVARGEAFGLVGGNGSGKSTLLKLVAGILKPSRGRVTIDGRVSALIELGAGFHPEISGRENVFINAAVLGLTRVEVAARFDSIVEFAGLEDFIDEPVKNYSSGMYVRLGFAVAVHTDPDVLLVDEILSVGDEAFAHRGLRRIEEMLAAGKTLLVVSHSLGLMETLCDWVLWLDRGVPKLLGEPRRVIDAYRLAVAEEEGREHGQAQRAQNVAGEGGPDGTAADALRWGSREAEIAAVRLRAEDGGERYVFASGEPMTVEIDASAPRALEDFVFGIAIATPRGVECFGTNTDVAGFTPRRFSGAATVRLHFGALRLAAGEYEIDVAVHARDGKPYDYRRKLVAFTVTEERPGVGVYAPEHRWELAGGAEAAAPALLGSR
jgi:ABC-type polysaccharide/polyol phosphate transport system ATPase subunit